MDKYLEILYKLAYKSYKIDEIPVGSIVVYKGKIIGKGFNNRQKSHFVCGHAEINAIKQAEKYLGDWRLNDCELYSTLKPCNMCNEVIKSSRISKVYYLIDQDKSSYNADIYEKIAVNNDISQKIANLMSNFFKKLR